MNYYICKYSYKYLSEIGNIFYYNDFLECKTNLNMISIGCGPCTDLMGIGQYLKDTGKNTTLNYVGIDLNQSWDYVHAFLKENYDGGRMNFLYEDIFQLFNEYDFRDYCDILSLQYLLSDMVKYNNHGEMINFIDELVVNVIMNMKENSIIIINDINHCKSRNYYENILSKMDEMNIDYECYRYHYDNSARPNHYHYGIEYDNNDLICNVPQNIIDKYNPWMFCSSAQLIIVRK